MTLTITTLKYRNTNNYKVNEMPTAQELGLQPGDVVRLGDGPKVQVLERRYLDTKVVYLESLEESGAQRGVGEVTRIFSGYADFNRVEEELTAQELGLQPGDQTRLSRREYECGRPVDIEMNRGPLVKVLNIDPSGTDIVYLEDDLPEGKKAGDTEHAWIGYLGFSRPIPCSEG